MKKILLKITIVACTVLALLPCSVSALDVVDSIDGVLVTVNGGRPLPAFGGEVKASQLTVSGGTYTVSRLDFFVPFRAPAKEVVLNVSLFCESADTVSSTASVGTYISGVFDSQIKVPVEGIDYGYSTVNGVARTNAAYKFDVSAVPAVSDYTWYAHIILSGTIVLNVEQNHLHGYVSDSLGGSTVASGSFSGKTGTGNFDINSYALNSTSYSNFAYLSDDKIYWKSLGSKIATLKLSALSFSSTSLTLSIPKMYSRSLMTSVAPITLSAYRTDDDAEAVAQLQQINTTLDGMATNLQTITDDYTAREDVGNDISGTTSDDQIASGNAGMSAGSSSVSGALSGLPDLSTVISPATSFIAFLSAPITQIFEFGDGYLLYIATTMVICCVIFFVLKRMGGGSD